MNLLNLVNSDYDLSNHVNNVLEKERLLSGNKAHNNAFSLDLGESFFTSFCGNLQIEGFEKGRIRPESAGLLLGPLNYFTSVGKFQPEEILPGISVTTISPITGQKPILGLYGHLYRGTESKVIYAETAGHNLLIDFTTNDVQSVSLDILSFPYPESQASQKVTIEVTYNSGEVHTETVTSSISGLFWGFTGKETISQVILSSTNSDAWVGVDNIAFGLCQDNDGDGCLDVNDGQLYSNLEVTVTIGSCNTHIPNKMTSACGVSMSDLMDRLEKGRYRNKGAWLSSVTNLSDQWVLSGLITLEQKNNLITCAQSYNYSS